ncbi:MAG: hypothetical protein ACR2IF_06235 [Terriglobales bacterium]
MCQAAFGISHLLPGNKNQSHRMFRWLMAKSQAALLFVLSLQASDAAFVDLCDVQEAGRTLGYVFNVALHAKPIASKQFDGLRQRFVALG